jgi:hypothetical protein
MQQENTNFETATMLKKDAVLTIKVGTGFVNRVYKLINYLYIVKNNLFFYLTKNFRILFCPPNYGLLIAD